ncbi:MAG: SDR family NAD(P)-dependent oxidoreductase [Candidatus ainarchaeum sp.]|nr:SDR family NAD(P)-dependent oxidoreductase [Candidatus ainarchaeum sp.]
MAYFLKEMKGARCLVLGGLGFIGSNTAHRLASLGADVTVADACLDPYGWNFANVKEIREKIDFVKADVRDKAAMEAAVEGMDCVFNCAGQVSHLDSMTDPFLDLDINCRGALVVLEACRRKAENAKIVYAGTRAQMGALRKTPGDEEQADNPADIYGADKWAAEKYHLIYNSAYGLRATSLRINNTYGERHQMKHARYGILNWFVRLALEGKEIQVFGDGSQARDYNYVADVADAMVLAAQKGEADGKYYLLGSGKETRFLDMVKAVIAAAGSGSYRLVPWPPDRKAIEVGDFFVSYEKIRRELGWEPATPLERGLKSTVEFYRERRTEYW